MIDFKNTVYWKIYGDVFAFHKKFAEVREDDEYWERVVNASGEVYEKYKTLPEGEFAKQLILTVLDELERIYKDMSKKHG